MSYVFHSPVAVGGWQHFDLQSELKLTFVYDTAILWQDGIGSPPEAELQGVFSDLFYSLLVLTVVHMQSLLKKNLFFVLVGAMYPTSMRINEEGRLVVNFKTEARFRGQFVMSHPGKNTRTHTHTHTLMRSFYTANAIGLPCGAHPCFSYFWRSTLGFLPV